MAEFRPFHGIRYSAAKAKDYAQVTAPPYDVISSSERDALHERHPYNIIRLILGKSQPGDDASDNAHTRAAQFFENWRNEGVLVRDQAAGFYLTSVTFVLGGQNITRFGINGMVRLEPFEKGIILPHERTFSKVKSERLRLMKACHANLCPIFGIYSDSSGISAKLRSIAADMTPAIKLTDDKGLEHRLWHLTDTAVIEAVTQSLRDQRIYIADGHHRYETALNYREWVKAQNMGYTVDHPCNYVMMSLISMEDPGLVILPAHRLLREISQASVDRMLEDASRYFDIRTIDIQRDFKAAAEKVNTFLAEHAEGNTIGVYGKNHDTVYMLILKPGVMNQLFGHEMHAALLDLDVSVLTHLIMMEILGFDQKRLDDETKIAYRTEIIDSLLDVKEGAADLCFLLNPTRMDQVKQVAESGLIMPRKSTYFYPKEISGLVMNALKPAE